ncbi:MAG TPA: hypothetical protein VK179_01020 [Bacteroidales bacterium]|nr:hypothetical protein [Bacteroidales bacterium]
MKKFYFLILVLFAVTGVYAQVPDSVKKTVYGVEVNQTVTGSGFASGTELLLSMSEKGRNLAIGFYFCSEAKRFTGVIVHHEVALVRFPQEKRLVPFAFYHCIYRITKVGKSGSDSLINSFGTYKSFEHHLGAGIHARITNGIYLTAAVGYGLYLGSIKKPEILPVTGEKIGSNGFAPIASIGFGLRF